MEGPVAGMRFTFGPVPSRRLGRSIGINNIPPKNCTYSCVYCQVGRTTSMSMERREFYPPEDILVEVRARLESMESMDDPVDYLTVVPDGEPTLDTRLGTLLRGLRETGMKTAVITNASLIWDPEVRRDLSLADWVSIKVDSACEETWKKIDRPCGLLDLGRIMDGIREFSSTFRGDLVTETLLVEGLNDSEGELGMIGGFLAELNTAASYISIPTRPPAENWVSPPSEDALARAYGLLSGLSENVQYLISYEGEDFTSTDEALSDLLGIMAVHPMRESAVLRFLDRAGRSRSSLDELLENDLIKRSVYRGSVYYLRNFR